MWGSTARYPASINIISTKLLTIYFTIDWPLLSMTITLTGGKKEEERKKEKKKKKERKKKRRRKKERKKEEEKKLPREKHRRLI